MSIVIKSTNLAIVATIVVALPLMACSSKPAALSVAAVARPVKVIVVAPAGDQNAAADYPGVVRARVETPLAFRIPGKLTQRLVNLGDHVEAGQVLARLDDTDLELSLRNATAALAAAEAQRDNGKAELARVTALLAKGFATQAVVDQAQAAFTQADSALSSATAARDQAANQAGYAALLADTAGIVTALPAEAGQVVGAGQPVATLAADGPREVEFAVPETAVTGLAIGDTLAVRLWANAGQSLDGTVREISGSADPASRTYAVRLAIPPADWIRLGMSAVVSAKPQGSAGGDLVVPLSAVGQDGGKTVVWVVDPRADTVSPRVIAMQAFDGEGVRVTSGLSAGETIVAAGTQFMVPGEPVRIDATGNSTL